MRQGFFLLFLIVAFSSCVPAVKEDLTDVEIDFTDSIQVHILQMQDQQLSDSLIKWLGHEDATYRYLAARSFGSIQDEKAIKPLSKLLKDPISEVRKQAAFSLGQIGSVEAEDWLVESFAIQDSSASTHQFLGEVLEAIGKSGRPQRLEQIATVSTYLPTDTSLVAGQLWSIYRFALRGITSQSGTQRAIDVLTGKIYPEKLRWIASQYLMRAKDIDLTPHSAIINNALTSESNPEILMALAKASAKCQSKTNMTTLIDLFNRTDDYRVKINIIKAIEAKGYSPETHEILSAAVKNPNFAVAMTASEALMNAGTSESANDYKNMARDTSLNPQIRATLYRIAHFKFPFYYSISKGGINRDLNNWLRLEKDPYIQASLVSALSADPKNYRIALNRLGHEHPFARTSAATNLLEILDHPEFEIVLEPLWTRAKKEWHMKIKEAVKNGDPGVIAELSKILVHPRMSLEESDDLKYLDTAMLKLSLPEHVETYNMLGESIAKIFNRSTFAKAETSLGHPPSWEKLESWSDSTIARIETSKGTFDINFDVKIAPATVLNFIDLAERGYFNGKNFHRVVPNFVIQGGCSRGDGYGSLNYNIRSELTNQTDYHQAGAIGMASAGNHTESTQWFVTHCATPHLDGRYTLFAQVIKGLEVIHRIERNDIIKEIKIIRPN